MVAGAGVVAGTGVGAGTGVVVGAGVVAGARAVVGAGVVAGAGVVVEAGDVIGYAKYQMSVSCSLMGTCSDGLNRLKSGWVLMVATLSLIQCGL